MLWLFAPFFTLVNASVIGWWQCHINTVTSKVVSKDSSRDKLAVDLSKIVELGVHTDISPLKDMMTFTSVKMLKVTI